MAQGDPLISNATVQVLRAGVQVGPASLAAYIGPAKDVQYVPQGALQRRCVLMNVAADIQPRDDLLILTINNRTPRKPGPFGVESALEDGGSNGLELLEVYLIGF